MNIFFAGAQGAEKGMPEFEELVSNRLVSYHYMTPGLTDYYTKGKKTDDKRNKKRRRK